MPLRNPQLESGEMAAGIDGVNSDGNGPIEVSREFISSAVEIYDWAVKTLAHSRRELTEAKRIRSQTSEDLQLQDTIECLRSQLDHSNSQLATANLQLDYVNSQKDALLRSTSWRATAPLRASLVIAKSGLGRGRRAATPLLPAQGEQSQRQGIDSGSEGVTGPEHKKSRTTGKTFHIVCTRHTEYVANLLVHALRRYGFNPTISLDMPDTFNHDNYIVVCPQMFDRLPPFDKLICFQLEQSVSSRWLHGDYLDVLRSCKAVLEYAIENIRYLDGFGISYPRVHFVPVLPLSGYEQFLATRSVILDYSPEKETDVLFYGDVNIGRRADLLSELSKRFNIKILNGVFGIDLLREIQKTKVVLNLHYYEDALLETTRVSECLSLGVPVVSEAAVDAEHHVRLAEFVKFAQCGSVEDISDKLQQVLSDKEPMNRTGVGNLGEEFIFYIGRVLLALGLIDYNLFSGRTGGYSVSAPKIALSLPETWKRRKFLHRSLDRDTFVFDGVRASPGWVGAAASYKFLAERLLENGIHRAMIYEDDADFHVMSPAEINNFAGKIESIFGTWDVISGFVGDLHPESIVDKVVDIDGTLCVSINKMVSMVCNIYNYRALERMASWDITNLDVSNTIDRYLEDQPDLRVITTLPFLVEHEENLDSSLWNMNNSGMVPMIQSSKRTLRDKVWHYHARALLGK